MRGQPKKLSINRIYSYPNLSGDAITNIRWSPNGRYLSYILGDRTGKNEKICAFDLENKKRIELVDIARLVSRHGGFAGADDALGDNTTTRDWRSWRIQPGGPMNFQWFPDGFWMLVSVAGHIPHVVDIANSHSFPITKDEVPVRDAQVSPNGRYVSFVRGWDLYAVDVEHGGLEFAITKDSTEEFRSATGDSMGDLMVGFAHWWSPDSEAIAYIQTDERKVPLFWYADLTSSDGQNCPERYPQPGDHLPVTGLKVARGENHVLIDTSKWPEYYLARVSWLPNSRHIALQLLSRDQKELVLVLADSFTGATQVMFIEKDPCWINIVNDWRFFSDSKRFLWSSERDSMRYLYIYDINGNQLAQLTDGAEACVSVNALDEKNSAVYYQVFPEPYTDAVVKRVNFTAGKTAYKTSKPVTLTTEPGSHFAHISPDFKHFGDSHSSAVQPLHLDLCTIDGEKVSDVENNSIPELEEYGLEKFNFGAHEPAQLGIPSDKMKVYSKLLEPANREKGKKYPVVVYVYGGPLPGGFGLARNVLNYWRPVPELWMQMMAQKGYGIFSLDNRGSNAAARGHDFETPIHKRLGHVEIADQLKGVEYLKTLDWVDPDRIGILGGSFGGFMTLNAMMRTNNTFKAGCAFSGVTDWSQYDAVYTERYMESPDKNIGGYEETDVQSYAGQLENELLLIHGGSDPNVHLQHTFQLIERLVENSKKFDLLVYPNQKHMSFFGMGQSPERLWTRITDFFTRTLS